MAGCSSLLSLAVVKKTDQKQSREGKDLSGLMPSLRETKAESQGKKPEDKTPSAHSITSGKKAHS